MPGFDGTGPMGIGPAMGRGFGPCVNPIGRGFGRRMMFAQGRRGWPQTKKDQLQTLRDYKTTLGEEIEIVEKELKNLEKEE